MVKAELVRVAAPRGTNKSALFKLLALPIGPLWHHPGGFQPAAGCFYMSKGGDLNTSGKMGTICGLCSQYRSIDKYIK